MSRRSITWLSLGLALGVLPPRSAAAAPEPPIPWERIPAAADLDRGEKAAVERTLRRERGYGACSEAIARCVAAGDRTALALARYVVFLHQRKVPDAEIGRYLADRRASVHPARTARLDVTAAPAIGPATAPVTVVEFADFECPFCAQSLPDLKRLATAFPGRVRVVFKQFPLKQHPGAVAAAAASLAAHRQGKFWEMAEKLFADPTRHDRAGFVAVAKALGLDVGRFQRDLADPALMSQVENDKIEGLRAGVDGTPTIYVNGKRYLMPKDPWVLRERVAEEVELAATGGR